MEEFNALYDTLNGIFEEFIRHKAYIENANREEIRLGTAHQRLSRLLLLQINFINAYNKLQTMTLSEVDKLKVDDIQSRFEDDSWDTVGFYQDFVSAHQSQAHHAAPKADYQQSSKAKVKFPTIPLPEFDGSPQKWLRFRDSFISMVHNKTELSTIEKFHFLIAAIKLPSGTPNILDNFTFSEEMYEEAWKAVLERYDDRSKLKSQHLASFFTVKKMTAESAVELRRILDSFTTIITTLEVLNVTKDDFLVHQVLFRLDDQTLKEWQKFIDDKDPSWDKLKEFLTLQWRALDKVPLKKVLQKPEQKLLPKPTTKTYTAETSHISSSLTPHCVVCKDTHWIYRCDKFRSLKLQERRKLVDDSKLCRNCLSAGHMQGDCTSKNRCKVCQKLHHTLLHDTSSMPPAHSDSSNESTRSQSPHPFVPPQKPNVKYPTQENSSSNLSSHYGQQRVQTLLSTVVAYAQGVNGLWHVVRILVDSGSQSNFATISLARKLGVPLIDYQGSVTGISKVTTLIHHSATIRIGSAFMPYEFEADCALMEDITGYLPDNPIDTRNMKLPRNVFLADPEFYRPAPIDLLLGTAVFHDSLLQGIIRLPDSPTLLETKFGWTLGGAFTSQSSPSSFISSFSCNTSTQVEEIDSKLEKFIELENYGVTEKRLTPEEKYCEDLYSSTTKRDATGRYIVRQPIKGDIKQLGNNYATAYRRFTFQEKVRLADDELNSLYKDYMREYESSGDMNEVEKAQDQGFFLPHHGVKKSSSTTTKVRPVFNASCKSETKTTLNDFLCVGPTVQPESIEILLRFREMSYVVKADIEKMYRQVFIEEAQRKFQKILWRESPTEPLRHIQLNTVTFGLASSAFLATRTLVQIALDNEKDFPQACAIIRLCFYVDDFIYGSNTIAECLKIRDQVRYILIKSHMPLRKWSSNHPQLLEGLHQQDIDPISDQNPTVNTLGHAWNPKTDEISFNMKSPKTGVITKADVLSEIASMYDPIGLVGPVVLKGKLFMKVLWQLKLEWAQELPDTVKEEWDEFRSTITSLNDLRIKRQVIIDNPVNVELHGFADASEDAYGVCIYLRSRNKAGSVMTSLICSKSRVSPLKKKSIARLELCAATLLSKLVSRIIATLTTQISSVTLWSDSMITLYWILTPFQKLSTFVGNRVSVIHEHTENFTWKHIKGDDNPADVISRGLLPHEIADCRKWWNGPSFFSQPAENWPESLITINEDDPEYGQEVRKCHLVQPCNSLVTLIESRFSKIGKLINSFVYLRRFASRSGFINRKTRGKITIEEREEATMNIIRVLQSTFFHHEYDFFLKMVNQSEKKENFPKKSSLLMLSPYMDQVHRVIRVSGRLQQCTLMSEDQKHPIILPNSHFTKLVIRDLHVKHSHPPANAMLSIVRQQYWPLKAKSIIRNVNRNCLRCFRVKPLLATQYMGSLPEARVTMTPPFTTTAVNYTSHFNMRSISTKKSTIKGLKDRHIRFYVYFRSTIRLSHQPPGSVLLTTIKDFKNINETLNSKRKQKLIHSNLNSHILTKVAIRKVLTKDKFISVHI